MSVAADLAVTAGTPRDGLFFGLRRRSLISITKALVSADARRSPATAVFRAAGRRGGNNDRARQIPPPTHAGANDQDRDRRRSARRSSLPRYGRAGSN